MKKYEIELDVTGFEDIPYVDIRGQIKRMQKEVNKFCKNIKVNGISDYGNCYSCSYCGFKNELIKMLKSDIFCYTDKDIADLEADDMFVEC